MDDLQQTTSVGHTMPSRTVAGSVLALGRAGDWIGDCGGKWLGLGLVSGWGRGCKRRLATGLGRGGRSWAWPGLGLRLGLWSLRRKMLGLIKL